MQNGRISKSKRENGSRIAMRTDGGKITGVAWELESYVSGEAAAANDRRGCDDDCSGCVWFAESATSRAALRDVVANCVRRDDGWLLNGM